MPKSDVVLIPCHGCGALFPPSDGPTHRYLGASAPCWALFHSAVMRQDPEPIAPLTESRVPETPITIPTRPKDSLDTLFGDVYGVQHHGDDSPQAIQSVALHLLNLHGIISGKTTRPGWPIGRALRTRGVFHKLAPPPSNVAGVFGSRMNGAIKFAEPPASEMPE